MALFDKEAMQASFEKAFDAGQHIIVYGEAFGGKQQGMSKLYGSQLRFMAFDVKINDVWLDVPSAEQVVVGLGLQFVPYVRGPWMLEFFDQQRDADCPVAIAPGMKGEGIVVRPIRELFRKDGSRVMFKHKRPEFSETKTVREVDPNQKVFLENAAAVAAEWVTPMRLNHVLQKTPYNTVKDTGAVIRAMQEDVEREGSGEFSWNSAVASAVAKETVKLLQTVPINNHCCGA